MPSTSISLLPVYGSATHLTHLFLETDNDRFSDICFILASVNSSINPVTYFLVRNFRKQQFRGSLKVAFQRAFEETEKPREEGKIHATEAVETLT
ncbi:mas-related G-protein coupled receptor member X4-like [Alligator sinensis]|uniref:Mas-related G-protein coupled receptor member X4-like n=1 Tax=Alligator sinensis TaxID=38654 RepID=A0A3Q0HMB5_ALLSI|nr:mas-related G-protein coupled receptor member X4-like [Alligator sinensis]